MNWINENLLSLMIIALLCVIIVRLFFFEKKTNLPENVTNFLIKALKIGDKHLLDQKVKEAEEMKKEAKALSEKSLQLHYSMQRNLFDFSKSIDLKTFLILFSRDGGSSTLKRLSNNKDILFKRLYKQDDDRYDITEVITFTISNNEKEKIREDFSEWTFSDIDEGKLRFVLKISNSGKNYYWELDNLIGKDNKKYCLFHESYYSRLIEAIS